MKNKQLAVYIPTVLIVLILVLLPFHAFLTVWGSSLFGHYTALRLWKELLVFVCLVGAVIIFSTDKAIRQMFYRSRLIQLMVLYFAIELIWGIVARQRGDVNTKALFYGWLSDCRYLVFFLITLIVAKKTSLLKNLAPKIVLYPAAIVIIFGLLQIFVLPHNFLSHFGYGTATIAPYETINSNNHLIRIASTLRGANPLGAYLIIPLTLATALLVRGRKVWQLAIFLAGGIIVMIFSYSRSAWIGLIISLALTIYLGLKSASLKKTLLLIGVGLAIVLGGIFIAERNNTHVQNIVFHYHTHSAAPTSSDQNHGSALKAGIKQVATEPLGRGPGTAGPASLYNDNHGRIAENYYIQIGQETGWLGLIVFLAINGLVLLSLWARRNNTIGLALLASFIGLIVCNLLLEAWTDDTLAYIWWGLAGIAIAVQPKLTAKAKRSNWIL